MFTKTTRILTVLFSITIMASLMIQPISAAYSSGTNIEPLWTNAASASLAINFENEDILITATITGRTGTTYKNGIITLEKVSGSSTVKIQEWTGLSSNSSIFQFRNQSIEKNKGTYRLTLRITAVRNGVSETITINKDASY